MSQIVKTYTGIFLLLLLVMTSAGILGAFLQVLDAQDMHARMIAELENSDYAAEVIRENIKAAKQLGYEPEVILYDENNHYRVYSAAEEVPADCGETKFARVNLSFCFCVPFLQINDRHTVSGYAG